MLILKLNLETATVSYNKLGTRTSEPVPFTKDRVKGIQMDMDITGYVASDAFFAFSMKSRDKALTTDEQFRLMTLLGFKTVPVYRYPTDTNSQTVNELIRIKSRFSEYEGVWVDTASNKEYPLPEVTTIKSGKWDVDPAGRVFLRINTPKGDFDILDQRYPEYFQVGCEVKVQGTKVIPYKTAAITDPIPTHCPKCNNPLKVFQIANDLPLILKCLSPVCKKLRLTDEPLPEEAITPEKTTSSDSVREPQELENDSAISVSEEPEPVDVGSGIVESELVLKPKLLSLGVEIPEEIAAPFTIVTEVPEDVTDIVGIVTKSKRSVTKQTRELANKTGLRLIPVDELPNLLNELREVEVNG